MRQFLNAQTKDIQTPLQVVIFKLYSFLTKRLPAKILSAGALIFPRDTFFKEMQKFKEDIWSLLSKKIPWRLHLKSQIY